MPDKIIMMHPTLDGGPEAKRINKVSDLSGLSKERLVTMIMGAAHGPKAVASAFNAERRK